MLCRQVELVDFLCSRFELVDFLLNCDQESHFSAARGHPRFCARMLMAGLQRFRLASARILFNQM